MAANGKSRMVSVRLSVQDYEQFRAICSANGGSKVPELLRSAVSYLLENGQLRKKTTATLEQRVAELESQVQSLMVNARAASSGS
jgi:hypothetical protein